MSSEEPQFDHQKRTKRGRKDGRRLVRKRIAVTHPWRDAGGRDPQGKEDHIIKPQERLTFIEQHEGGGSSSRSET